MQFYHIYF